jgi:peptide/nickel transport system substrate-binding protein
MTASDRMSRISRRSLLQTAGLGAAVLGTGAAGLGGLFQSRRAAAAAVGPDTLAVAQGLVVQTFDPQIVYDNTLVITRGFYEGLVSLKGSTPEIIPRLATSWKGTPDAREWTFKLRTGVRFHDGTTLTSEAVKIAVERLIKINRGLAYAFKGTVAKVDAPDPLTV